MNLREIWAKHEKADTLTDEELVFLTKQLIFLETTLYALGPKFSITNFYVIQEVARLRGYCQARGLSYGN